MTVEIDEFRSSMVAAVQAELERHAAAVVAEVDRLRDEARRERSELRADLTAQIHRLAESQQTDRFEERLTAFQTQIDDRFAESQQTDRFEERLTAFQTQIDDRFADVEQRETGRFDDQLETLKTQLEDRLHDAEQRQTRRLDEVTSSLESIVVETTRPMVADLHEENEQLATRVDTLGDNLRKFDEQAARMVTYFNDVSQQMEQRQTELAEQIGTEVTDQIAELKQIVDDNDVSVRKLQTEINQSVTQKLNDAEDRLNNRLLAAETRMKEENGQKIADIDLHVSRVSTNLDESLTVMNDRIAAVDERFTEIDDRIGGVEESIKNVDQDALEELKERMASAAGEAMLVRIEMERLEKSVGERADDLTVRMTEVESHIQDQTMDVSTAVQLERLEEVERALAELDPTQFVRVDGSDPTVSAGGPGAAVVTSSEQPVENVAPPADASSGPDIAAIIASAEGRSDHE